MPLLVAGVFHCLFCPAEFATNVDRWIHMRSDCPDPKLSEKKGVASHPFPAEISRDRGRNVIAPAGEYPCPVCGEFNRSEKWLRWHVKRYHSPAPAIITTAHPRGEVGHG